VQLIESWGETPAYVQGSLHGRAGRQTPLATALAPYYVYGENLVRAAFLDLRLRDMYEDWERIAETAVAGLRALVGPDVDDSRLK